MNIILWAFFQHNADRLLKLIEGVYRWLPLGTVVNNKVLVVHGGISDTTDLDLIRSLDRGKVNIRWFSLKYLKSYLLQIFHTNYTVHYPRYTSHPRISHFTSPRYAEHSVLYNEQFIRSVNVSNINFSIEFEYRFICIKIFDSIKNWERSRERELF